MASKLRVFVKYIRHILWTTLMLAPSHTSFASEETFPALAGSYLNSSSHPQVFVTKSDLTDLVTRINTKGSFSAEIFAKLMGRVKQALAAPVAWDATYSGCDIYIYLHAFSIESANGYVGQTVSNEHLKKELQIQNASLNAPEGAALVASHLALYAALVKAGAILTPGAPSANEAASLAKQIILAWAQKGFRNSSGGFVQSYCDGAGKPIKVTAALQIARGVVYSVAADDLLQYLGTVTPAEQNKVNSFHSGMYDLIRTLSNDEVEYNLSPGHYFGAAYNNQFASHIVALLAISRSLNDQRRFMAALYGQDTGIPVRMSWILLFNNVIYGVKDSQRQPMFPNSGPDGLTSHPGFTTPIVAAGEINDRYRNANPAQGIGYPMTTLNWLFDSAEILRIAGFDAYDYRGTHGQSIEMATQYYACFGKGAGIDGIVTAKNSGSCPDVQQYVGKKVNGLDRNILIGAYRFPENQAIAELNSVVESMNKPLSIDDLLFGYWKN